MKTGQGDKSGTNGPVHLTIFGPKGKATEELLLSSSSNDKSFAANSTKKFQINATDVGKPERISIRHEDKANGWLLDYVEITVHETTTK